MKIISKTLKLLPLFLLVLGLNSCSDDDDNNTPAPQTNTIVDVAVANGLTSLAAALEATNLVGTLQGPGPFTVLAPSNDAFTAFLTAANIDLDNLSTEERALVRNVLLNHVINGELAAADLISLGSGYTSTNAVGAGDNNMSIYFNASAPANVRFNNVSSVTTADVDADNGTVHVVNAVIGLPTIVDLAAANDDFSSLVAALGAADGDLVTTLNSEGPFTVLAPNNAAFATFLDGTPLGNVDTAVLSQLLLNHVINGSISAADLTGLGSGYSNTRASGPSDENLSIYFDTDGGVTFNGASTVFNGGADIVGTNGIIHGVDTVIAIPTIATFATTNPALSNLVSALQLADTGTPTVMPSYIEVVSDDTAGPFTVFAPTNDAFADLLLELDPSGSTALGDLDPATVDAVLLMHIVNGNIQSTGLPNGMVTTLGGDITADNTAFTLTDPLDREISIVTTLVDIQAANGVVHVVGRVIRPGI